MDATVKTRSQRIDFFVRELKKKQPDLLEKELNRLYLLSDAARLDASVSNNSITLEEIIEEVNAVRKNRYTG
ncbi:MAG: hypothetical protein WCZ43_14340 [Proteiniphilum sp.]